MPSGYKHGDTPKKVMVRGTISYLESQGLPVNKSAIFKHFDLSRSQGYAALTSSASKRNDPEWAETRGRPSKITPEDQQKMEAVLWDAAYEDANLNWTGLAKAGGLEMVCNQRTLHRTMGTLSYRRCMSCGRCWTHKRQREKRCDWARKMLEAMPRPLDWRAVRFSGELHFGFGLDGKVRLIPRVGEKLCASCELVPDASWARDVKRVHVWAAVGYGFKSHLVFYEKSTNPSCAGIMTMPEYCDLILDKTVKSWLSPAQKHNHSNPLPPQSFILEEDAELFAHGSLSKVNTAQQWKEVHSLRHHFNCGESPDLSPLDALWPPGKQWTLPEPLPDWEDETLRATVRELWKGMAQERVDMWVDVMGQRLAHVLESDGRMVAW